MSFKEQLRDAFNESVEKKKAYVQNILLKNLKEYLLKCAKEGYESIDYLVSFYYYKEVRAFLRSEDIKFKDNYMRITNIEHDTEIKFTIIIN